MRAFVWVIVVWFAIKSFVHFFKLLIDGSDDTSGDAFVMALHGGVAIWGALVL